jgi:hypothetical protein
MSATTIERRSTPGRLAYAALGALLLSAAMLEATRHDTSYWLLAAFGLGPDLALFYGAGAGLEPGQLHPRAVRAYNLVHRFWGPLGLAALASLELVPFACLIGALAWALHIALDRSLGYGLRARDGFQRP